MTRKILITGASGDIGRALVELLAPGDVRIAAHYFQADPAALLWPDNVLPLQADLSDPMQAAPLVDAATTRLGGLDVLVQLAGDLKGMLHWTELSLEQWLHDMHINLTSTFLVVQAAQQHLRQSSAGRIVLMSSAYASRGHGATSAAYAISKVSVEALTRILARDLARHGILVNCVAPGFILGRFSTTRSNRSPEQVKARLGSIPLGRHGTPRDVAREITHLVSEDNLFTTGEVVRIDGGDFI